MSYFVGGRGNWDYIQSLPDKLFSGLGANYSPDRTHTVDTFLISYPEPKVIRDIVLEDTATGSWLRLLGMPLVDEKLLHGNTLLEQFFKTPSDVLRHRIDGHFALFAYDAVSDLFYIASDFNSFIPIFYTESAHGVLFCSSELILARMLQKELAPLGFAQSVYLGSTWGTGTRYAGIEKLGPCELVAINSNKKIHKTSYWRPQEETIWPGNFDAILDRWMQLLRDSVNTFYRQAGVKSVSADLTGGEDSRLIVAQCFALKIPFRLRVCGYATESDVILASEIAQKVGLDLSINEYLPITSEHLLTNAQDLALRSEGYGSFFSATTKFEMLQTTPPPEYRNLHLAGVPGGEVYRGSYYLRAGLLFPSRGKKFDDRQLTRLKFLLDYAPNLISNEEFLNFVYVSVKNSMKDVSHLPAGTQVDHVLRMHQNAPWGLSVRQPFYLPLGLKELTRSIYGVPPKYKNHGQLTRAATELLFPKLAYTKSQANVPTIRRTIARLPLFVPGYYALAKKLALGAIRRMGKFQQKSNSLARHHRIDHHAPVMQMLLNNSPYADWFKSSATMITGQYYNSANLNQLLSDAKEGKCKHVQLLGRMINQELAARYVAGEVSTISKKNLDNHSINLNGETLP